MNTLNKTTLSGQIYQILRDDIFSGAIPQGTKLTLKQLQERFGVSSTAIREALIRLTEDGLTDYLTNVGVKVVLLNENDIRELYEYMGDLDALAILYTAKSTDLDTVRKELTANMEESAVLLNKKPLTEDKKKRWTLLSDRFHLLFYDYCNNSRLKRSAERQRTQLTIFSNQYEAVPEIQLSIESGHRSIYDAFMAGEYEQAAALMRAHLGVSYRYALEFMKKQ